MDIKTYLKLMLEKNASDMFYRAGANVRMRIDGKVVSVDDRIISLDEVNDSVKDLTSNELRDFFQRKLDVDFGMYIPELNHRFRISIFMQRNCQPWSLEISVLMSRLLKSSVYQPRF